MLSAIQANQEFQAAFEDAATLASEHFQDEAEFLRILKTHSPALAAKIECQHEEILELARAVRQALADGQSRDARQLVRRFQALAQHNIIEEERDVFPVASRCFEF